MFEDDKDKEEEENNYDAFGYDDDENINISQTNINRMLQKKRLERKQRKGNIWISRLHVLLRLLIIIATVYALYRLVNTTKWFVPKDIFTTSSPNLEVINNEIVPTYKILNELRKIPVVNEPIYKFETDKIRLNLIELEPIENIYIRRYWWPARLQIIVQERKPLLAIFVPNSPTEIGYFTEDGVLIGGDYLPLSQEVSSKTLKVIASNDFREWDKIKINSIKSLADYVQQLTNEKVECINMSNPNDVYIKLSSNLLRVGAIDDGIYDRISRLTSILPTTKTVQKNIKYIDLRWKSAVYFKTE